MDTNLQNIDHGRAFDWNKSAADYAEFRDIYPAEFYERIAERGLCIDGQQVLDLGTGSGVLPRNMLRFGAQWTACDASASQIAQARRLSQGSSISYFISPAEDITFAQDSFDVVTACQCFVYFDHARLAKTVHRVLNPNGRFLILYMAWLPAEDEIAKASEECILKYNPAWTGGGELVHPIEIPELYTVHFHQTHNEEYRLRVPFTRAQWHGRMRACRGTRASMTDQVFDAWEREHAAMLQEIVDDQFSVAHYVAMAELAPKAERVR